jgi:acyl-CoA reductase-like NAD-dependent aldehyde dehydrogenase
MAVKVEEFGHFIGGKWVVPARAKRFETVNPSTGEKVGSFVAGTPEDVRAAISAAADAFPTWRDTPAPKRGEILLEVAMRMRKAKPTLGRRSEERRVGKECVCKC